jgi:hypothetical protein
MPIECGMSAELVRNQCGTSAERNETKAIETTNMPQSKRNFIIHGLSCTFPGIGHFHRRGAKTFLRKIRAKPPVPDSEKTDAVKILYAASNILYHLTDPLLSACAQNLLHA